MGCRGTSHSEFKVAKKCEEGRTDICLMHAGYVAVVPDFFKGQALTPGFDFSKVPEFLAQFPRDKVCSNLRPYSQVRPVHCQCNCMTCANVPYLLLQSRTRAS